MKRTEIESLLPEVVQRTVCPGGPLLTLLEVMEALHAPSEAVLAKLETYFHPYCTPDEFVPYLARWVDLERLVPGTPGGGDGASEPTFPSGLGRLRELVAAAAFLSSWRGTRRGLLRFLETATGSRGFEIQEQVFAGDGLPRPFHILVQAPQEAEGYRPLIERIVEMEKPAYVTYELEFR